MEYLKVIHTFASTLHRRHSNIQSSCISRTAQSSASAALHYTQKHRMD
jgi:hypothetical protein